MHPPPLSSCTLHIVLMHLPHWDYASSTLSSCTLIETKHPPLWEHSPHWEHLPPPPEFMHCPHDCAHAPSPLGSCIFPVALMHPHPIEFMYPPHHYAHTPSQLSSGTFPIELIHPPNYSCHVHNITKWRCQGWKQIWVFTCIWNSFIFF